MYRRSCLWLTMVLTLAAAGCGADRAELERVKAELAATRAELKALQANQPLGKQGYLEELERLAALQANGALTKEEFEAKKRGVLAGTELQPPPQASTEALAKQLRTLQTLFNNNTITHTERDRKKQQLLQKPLALTDLKKDLELVQALFNENVVTHAERDVLKQRLLEIDKGK